MKIINPKLHGALDYTVATALIVVPLACAFADTSLASAAIAVAAGVGLLLYSLATDYSAGLRGVISYRTHLNLDAIAGVVLIAAPLALGFSGIARAFYLAVGLADLAVVALSDRSEQALPEGAAVPT